MKNTGTKKGSIMK